MTLPVFLYGSSILRKHSSEINPDDNYIETAQDLIATLKAKEGIGLAGPQTGILKRIFFIDTSPLCKSGGSIEKYEKVFINPEILKKSTQTEIYEEGCLSIPGIFEEVVRPGIITVRYQDMQLNTIEEELNGIVARVFQHEYDHLEGILFIDKISPIRKVLLRGRLEQIRKNSGSRKK